MSGIAAIFERSGAPVEAARITGMLARLRRRGPDRAAHHVDGSVALAQALFATTPEDAFEKQPLRSRGGARWIVADARLDNRDELLRLRTETGEPVTPADRVADSELILWAYERWGEGCPSHLVGDFAFIVWDREHRRLFCARDHLGVRVLYYHHDAASFRCASEMHTLFADERVARRPHRRSVALFLADQYSERDETLYDGVHALPPGHTLSVTATAIRREAYWRPNPWHTLPAASDEDHAARFHAVFAEAVRGRLRANRALAASVSGGLDSSAVAVEAERLRRTGVGPRAPLMLFRAAFPGFDCDEQVYSDALAQHLGLLIDTCYPAREPDICRLEQVYPDHYFHPSLTMVDPLLDQIRRRGIRVVLTGAGGDMVMEPTGYEGVHHLRHGRLGAAIDDVDLRSTPFSPAAWRRLAGQGLRALSPRLAGRLGRARAPARSRWPWLSRAAADMVDARLSERDAEIHDLHPDLLVADTCHAVTHGVGTVLTMARNDRAGALDALEYRHPFFDVRVVELLLALPLEQRFTRWQTKSVLRRALGSGLPERIRQRRDKADFGLYVRRVFLEDQRDALQRLLRASLLEEEGLIDPSVVRSLLAAPPEAQRTLALVDLAAMELWLRHARQPILDHHFRAPHEDQHEVA